jgi:hypothetical protein
MGTFMTPLLLVLGTGDMHTVILGGELYGLNHM